MVKTYLMAQDLWDTVGATSLPPKQEDDEVAFKAWSKKNSIALDAIQNSCGPDLISNIREISVAKIAWDTLAAKCHTLGNTNSSGIFLEYGDLHDAVRSGDWNAAKEFLDRRAGAVSAKITYKGDTALYIAVASGHMHLVKELVELMSEEDLEVQEKHGYTALAEAVVRGNYRMAECLLSKSKRLISIRNSKGSLPVVMAISYGQIKLARYLYPFTPLDDLKPEKDNGATLFTNAIYTRTLDIALDLMERCPCLALALDKDDNSPLVALASMPNLFPSGSRLVFWKRWIYKYGIHIQLARATDETRVNIQRVEKRENDQVKTIRSVPARLRRLVSNVLDFFGIGDLHEMKSIHVQSHKLLCGMCKEISKSNSQQRHDGGVYTAIILAIKKGNFEFVSEMVSANPELARCGDDKSRNIFMCAVLYRQAKTFSLIFELDLKNTLTCYKDDDGNGMLHMVGTSADSTMLHRIPGAALQLQRELQWFKEVESIVPSTVKEAINKDGLTPRELFTENYKNMTKEGEKWMKGTATSCIVVGALTVTIMFAAAFTIPEDNDQNIGFPIFINEKLFMLFIISDALSLFSSTTSVLMFLRILTSHYTEDDFLESLPRKMIIGLSTLFFSIAAMMISFSAALLIMLHKQTWIIILIICLASVPVTLFILMQFPLLVVMSISTYGPGIFDRKIMLGFN